LTAAAQRCNKQPRSGAPSPALAGSGVNPAMAKAIKADPS